VKKLVLLVTTLAFLVLTACAGPSAPEAPAAVADVAEEVAAETGEVASPEVEHIDLGVGFIPNIQFAPFYVAQTKGFYAEEGLEVALEYGFENDFVALTAQGERQFAVASGDQVILSRAQGLPLVYIMKWYERFPVALMALEETGIDSPEKLAGHSLGLPGLFGANYVAWEALAFATGLNEETVNLEEIGFTQAEAISQKQVDAAMVYIANEPIQLTQQGLAVNVIEVSDYIDLVSNGLVTNEKLIAENPELIGRLVRATLKGVQYTIDNPEEAFDISRTFIPEITDADAPTQRLVLDASIDLWRSDQPGVSSPEAWATSADFMLKTGLIQEAIEVDSAYTNDFVE
jgi:NitT/TauT family transport system substrate-binding protein